MAKELRFRKWHIVVFSKGIDKDGKPYDYQYTKENLFKILSDKKSIHYFICGEERTPTTDEKHFHAYVEFDNACTFESIKKLLPKAHIEDAHGTATSNKSYITKEDTQPLEIGTPVSIKYGGDDIASNIMIYLFENPSAELFNIAIDVPEFADYIVKNFRNLSEIKNAINENIKQRQIAQELGGFTRTIQDKLCDTLPFID